MWYPLLSQKPGSSRFVNCSPLTHLADFRGDAEQQPRRPTVIRFQRPIVVPQRDHCPSFSEVRGRNVCRIPIERMREKERRGWLQTGGGEQVVDGNTLPEGIELRPTGHAMNIARDFGLRQLIEFRPCPLSNNANAILQPRNSTRPQKREAPVPPRAPGNPSTRCCPGGIREDRSVDL